jgi:hypothetical protein
MSRQHIRPRCEKDQIHQATGGYIPGDGGRAQFRSRKRWSDAVHGYCRPGDWTGIALDEKPTSRTLSDDSVKMNATGLIPPTTGSG